MCHDCEAVRFPLLTTREKDSMSRAREVAIVAVALVVTWAVTPGYAARINCPGNDGAGTCLQDVLDDRAVARTAGASSVDVDTDQVANSAYWTWSNTAIGSTHIIAEITSFVTLNTFGIFDAAADPSKRVELFEGGDSAGHKVSFTGDVVDAFFSAPSLNPDAPFEQMVAVAGQGDLIQLPRNPLGSSTQWNADGHVLAWENLPASSPAADFDFNDLVVMVESIKVPEPATLLLLLLGSGLAGAGLFGWKRFGKKSQA